jgi:hypothetical protein
MTRKQNLLIDKLRTRAWVNAFLAELQGIKGTSTPLSPSGAVKILDKIIANNDIIPDSKKTVKEVFPDEDTTPELTSQFHRWMSGKSLISSTNRLISLFSFSELVFTTGIPQTPALHNIRIPDEEFETFTPEEKKQGKIFVFDFYDAPPLWTSVKGTPHQILEAWTQVKAKSWLFWHPDNTNIDVHEIDLTTWQLRKPLSPEHYSFKDESELAYTLDRVSDHPVPPIVNLTSQIAAARLVEDQFVCLGPHFPSNEVQIELKPFGIELDEIWNSLDEVGCPPRFI